MQSVAETRANAYKGGPLPDVGTCRHHATNFSSLLQRGARDDRSFTASGNANCAVDVVLVLDRSSSVKDYYSVLNKAAADFVRSLTKKATGSGSHVGVVSFSKTAQLEKSLSPDYQSVIDTINAGQKSKGTNLQDGLMKAEGEIKRSTKPSGHQVVLVITDGVPSKSNGPGSDHKSVARDAAISIKNHARLVFVAVGLDDPNYMKDLSTQPPTGNFYDVADWSGLTDTFVESLVSSTCEGVPPTPPSTPTPPLAPTPVPGPPTPPTPCSQDTRAPCASPDGLCFQNTRGKTYCNKETNTCWCSETLECVYFKSFLFTRNSSWGVCRLSEDDIRAERNPVTWFFAMTRDIFSAYWHAITTLR